MMMSFLVVAGMNTSEWGNIVYMSPKTPVLLGCLENGVGPGRGWDASRVPRERG
jgi:hypothetical protein